jgi:hypothetical protein
MWFFNNELVDESILDQYVGFVYKITRISDGKSYIGKKLLKSRRTKILKGKKKKITVDSDWKKYWGSNKFLQEDVKTLGEDNFKREILKFCKTKGELNYFEAKYQFDYDVLESESFYNEWIMVRVHSSHIKKALQPSENLV